jgi:molybdopterin converting factor small subunit
MKIKISAYGILKSYLGQGSVTAIDKEISPSRSIKEIISEIGIPDGMVMMIAVNDQQKDLNYVPQEGDDIKLIPPISGG